MRNYFTHADPILPVHYPRSIFDTALEQGADPATLLTVAGLTRERLESPDERISYLQFAALCGTAVALTGNAALGLDVGAHIRLANMGLLGLTLMNCPTLGAAMLAMVRHNRLLAPAHELRFEVVDQATGRLTLHEAIPLAPFDVFVTEMVLSALREQTAVLRRGKHTFAKRVRLHYPKPSHFERYLEHGDIFDFEQSTSSIDFDLSMLSEPIAFADPATAKVAERTLLMEYSDPATPTRGLVEEVRSILETSAGTMPEFSEVSRVMRMSQRALRRSLAQMGTSYREIAEQVRKAQAVEWTRTTSLTQSEIAVRLGFSDVHSFRRAFKRWTGKTPGEYRAREPIMNKRCG